MPTAPPLSPLLQQQFFISSLPKEEVTNKVAEALRFRIARAYRQGQTFRVIIVMPLLPSFPAGEFNINRGMMKSTKLQTLSVGFGGLNFSYF